MNIGILSNLLKENSINNNRIVGNSLEKLSTGLKINKAADDASGLAISDKLRTQATGIKQGIDNANSAITMMNIADKSMTELSSILDTIKAKAIQMNTDTTSQEGRKIIKTDILKLIENYDDIVCRTNYNQTPLLNGCATPFTFQVGENSSDIISVDINNIESRQMGEDDPFKLKNFITGFNVMPISTPSTTMGSSSEGVLLTNGLANKTSGNSNPSGAFMIEVPSGTKNLTLYLNEYSAKDTFQIFTKDGKHVSGTPSNDSISWQTGYSPLDIILTYSNKFNIDAVYQNELSTYQLNSTTNNLGNTSVNYIDKDGVSQIWTMGSYDEMVVIPEVIEDLLVFVNGNNSSAYETAAEWSALGVVGEENNNATCACDSLNLTRNDDSPTLLHQAQSLMRVIDEALNQLNSQRSNVAAGTNQLESTAKNMMTSYVNVKNAESVIRDLDYASESANFNKANIISQAGSFVQSQANNIDKQYVSQLLK
jgi:flagellin